MSLGDLGQVLGVSRRTISKYEGGMGTTLDVAIRIEEFFNAGVVESIDLIRHEPPKAMEGEQKERCRSDDPWSILNSWGCSWHTLHGAPFQALLTFEKHIVPTGYGPAQKS